MNWTRIIGAAGLLSAFTGTAQAATLFQDDFSSNQGWTLENTWDIGATSVSPTAVGGSDPAFDHTASGDNGVLGAGLGSNVGSPDGLHDFWWATSPVIDASAASTVFLDFYRWLNTDYDPYMTSSIQGWDGSAWQTIYATGATGVYDSSWVGQSFDVSSIAANNANFQLRFGYDVTNTGVYTIGGWNVDDLCVGSGAACAFTAAAAVPVPAALPLLGGGLGLMGLFGWRRKRVQSA